MKVRWGNTIFSSYKVDNGLKQGGILLPVLFNIYMYMAKFSSALNDTVVLIISSFGELSRKFAFSLMTKISLSVNSFIAFLCPCFLKDKVGGIVF